MGFVVVVVMVVVMVVCCVRVTCRHRSRLVSDEGFVGCCGVCVSFARVLEATGSTTPTMTHCLLGVALCWSESHAKALGLLEGSLVHVEEKYRSGCTLALAECLDHNGRVDDAIDLLMEGAERANLQGTVPFTLSRRKRSGQRGGSGLIDEVRGWRLGSARLEVAFLWQARLIASSRYDLEAVEQIERMLQAASARFATSDITPEAIVNSELAALLNDDLDEPRTSEDLRSSAELLPALEADEDDDTLTDSSEDSSDDEFRVAPTRGFVSQFAGQLLTRLV